MKLDNFSNYEINPFKGTIFNLKTKKYLFGSPDKDGYMRIGLRDDTGVRRYFKIHRLFWTLVNGEIPEGYHIHHINKDITDNRLDNLQSINSKEHLKKHKKGIPLTESTKKKLSIINGKKCGAFANGILVMQFHSASEAGKNGFTYSSIIQCCNGLLKHHKGYEWQWLS